MRQINEPEISFESLSIGEQRRLQKAVAIKVYELDAELLDQRNRFKELYRLIKNKFAVPSYKEINRKDLQTAIQYIEGWYPSEN